MQLGQGGDTGWPRPPGHLPVLHLQHRQQRKPTVVLTGTFQPDQSPGPPGSVPRHHTGTGRGTAAGPAVSAATRPPLNCNLVAARCSSNSCGRLRSPNPVRPREAGTRSSLPTALRLTLGWDCFDSSHQTAEVTALSGDGRGQGCPVCRGTRACLGQLLSLTRAKGLGRDGEGRKSLCQAGVPLSVTLLQSWGGGSGPIAASRLFSPWGAAEADAELRRGSLGD